MKVHPLYTNHREGYDIAVIKLDSLLTFNQYVMPVRIADGTIDKYSTGDKLFAVGWGATAYASNTVNTLIEVQVPFVSDDTC